MENHWAYGLTIRSELPLPELLDSTLNSVDLRVVRRSLDPPRMRPTTIRRQGIVAEFGGSFDAAYMRWHGVATFLAKNGNTLMVDSVLSDSSPSYLNTFLLAEPLGLVLAQRGDYLVHGSAVRIGDRAVLFVGDPGAGKSTLAGAFYRRGFPVLADDMVSVRLDGAGEPHVLPSFPEIGLWPDSAAALGYLPGTLEAVHSRSSKRVIRDARNFDRTPTRLHSIYGIDRFAVTDVSVSSVASSTAFIVLTRYSSCPSDLFVGKSARRHFLLCRKLLDRVTMWRLRRPFKLETVDDVVSQILAHNEQLDLDGSMQSSRKKRPTPATRPTRYASEAVRSSPMRATGRPSVHDLFHPTTAREFFENYFEKRTLVIKRDDPHYYDSILSASELQALFDCPSVPSSTVRVHKKGREYGPGGWSSGGIVSNESVFELLSDGATFIVNGAYRHFSKLNEFCLDVEREIQFRVHPNIYITPPVSQGFNPHWDDHDVCIMQIFGQKKWRLYHSPVPLACVAQKHDKSSYELGAPTQELVLSPGDLLYIPRGLIHDAETMDSASAHITFGLHPPYFFTLLQQLSAFAQERSAFRAAAAHGFMTPEQRTKARDSFRSMLRELVEQVDVEELEQAVHDRFVEQRRPSLKARFAEVTQLDKLRLESTVRVRSGSLYSCRRNGRSIVLRVAGEKISMPLFLEPSINSVLTRSSLRVKDIGGLVNDTGRLDLVRKLIVSGLLDVTSFGERPSSNDTEHRTATHRGDGLPAS